MGGRIAGGASTSAFAGSRSLSSAAPPRRPACPRTSIGASSWRLGLIEWGLVVGVELPIRSLTGLAGRSRYAHKGLVQGKIVTNGVLGKE
jgi:hypothetical protein